MSEYWVLSYVYFGAFFSKTSQVTSRTGKKRKDDDDVMVMGQQINKRSLIGT